MKWHVYMLMLHNGTIYVGHTNDLNRRLSEHTTARGSKATKDSRPTELIYSELFPDHNSAILREKQLKSWTKAKKLALASGGLDQFHHLSKSHSHRLGKENPDLSKDED